MSTIWLPKLVRAGLLLGIAVPLQSCNDQNPVETVSISLTSTENYQYPAVGGDEDGARITTQARHYATSEIRRNELTNWHAAYVYQPQVGFAGGDTVEIEIFTGSDGASGPRSTRKIVFHFSIHR